VVSGKTANTYRRREEVEEKGGEVKEVEEKGEEKGEEEEEEEEVSVRPEYLDAGIVQ